MFAINTFPPARLYSSASTKGIYKLSDFYSIPFLDIHQLLSVSPHLTQNIANPRKGYPDGSMASPRAASLSCLPAAALLWLTHNA